VFGCATFLQVRFDFFCKAVLEFLLKTGRQPDILHCHHIC
jgi:starch synthase